jgi:hypothetical protein
MKTSFSKSNEELRESILQLLWQQWTALGLSGHVSHASKTLVDPEALLLFSTVFARHDVRLFDEMADWLLQNGTWINVQRLTRLHKEHELGDKNILGALAEHMIKDSAHTKWKVLAKRTSTPEVPQSLFPQIGIPGQTDPIFAAWGWLRPPLEKRGLSRPPRPNQPASFLLKLRALSGRQSRAEVLAWLLTHESGHPAQIARETGYFRGSIQNVLNELELSGHVFATREGREKHFVARKDQWRFLLTWDANETAEFPQWVTWTVVFTLIQRFHALVSSDKFATYSDDLQAIELNRTLAPHSPASPAKAIAPKISPVPRPDVQLNN